MSVNTMNDDHIAAMNSITAIIAILGTSDTLSISEQVAELKAQRDALDAENAGLTNRDLYIALRTESNNDILNDKHLTICYMSASATTKLDVNRIMPEPVVATVSKVEYWERVNLTVAIIDSPDIHNAHEVSKTSGFTYDLEFIPHVTLGCGDITNEHQYLVGKILSIGNPYLRIKETKKQPHETSAFLAEVRAQGVEMAAKSEQFSTWVQQGLRSFAIGVRQGDDQ